MLDAALSTGSAPMPPAETPVVGRFAPSPTGRLHEGSIVAALASFLSARSAGGRWLLRIEDIDPPREQPGAAQAILDDLARLGLDWDGPVYWQSQREQAYAAALARLRRQDAVFPCACSRQDLAPLGLHRGSCVRPWRAGQPHAWRLRMPAVEVAFDDRWQGRVVQDPAQAVGDIVLQRRDGLWAYHLAVVVDDAEQGVTEVIRGADLLDSTPRQILLQRALGLPTPVYGHVPLVLDHDGRKLSKSQRAAAFDAADGAAALRRALQRLGQAPAAGESCSAILARAVAQWDPARVPAV